MGEQKGFRTIERFNRTLRGKIHRHITSTRGGRFLDDLKDMVRIYNATPHATIGMAPRNVDFSNQEDVWNRMYESDSLGMSKRKPKLKAGDHVRMTKTRGSFDRGFTPKWTEEIFMVSEVLLKESLVV